MAIQGLKQLNRKLKEIPVAAKVAAKDAVIQGANEIADMQRNLAPVDQGDLRDSIHVTKPGERTPPYSQPGGSMTAGPEQSIVTAGNSDVRYAHLVEFGTAPHVILGRKSGILGRRNAMGLDGRFGTKVNHPGAKKQPFFWPGYRAVRNRVRSRVTRTINKTIRQAALKGGVGP